MSDINPLSLPDAHRRRIESAVHAVHGQLLDKSLNRGQAARELAYRIGQQVLAHHGNDSPPVLLAIPGVVFDIGVTKGWWPTPVPPLPPTDSGWFAQFQKQRKAARSNDAWLDGRTLRPWPATPPARPQPPEPTVQLGSYQVPESLAWKFNRNIEGTLERLRGELLDIEDAQLSPDTGAELPTEATSTPRVTRPGGIPARHFRKEGDYWNICFEGITTLLKDQQGAHHLAHLLRNPDKTFTAVEMQAARAPNGTAARLLGSAQEGKGAKPLDQDFLSISSDSTVGEVIDDRALTEYKQRLSEIADELQLASGRGSEEEVQRLRNEQEWLRREISAASTNLGNLRRARSSADKARQAVSKSIDRAIDALKLNDRKLGEHLESRISKGFHLIYQGDGEEWGF